MIAFVTGPIVAREKNALIIKGSGIGYRVYVPLRTLSDSFQKEEEFLYTYLRISDQAHDLFGFETQDELALFEALVSVNGIGPKIAMGMMWSQPERVYEAVESQDSEFLSSLPGIGKKTANRMIVELSEKLPKIAKAWETPTPSFEDDVIEALTQMGYKKPQIETALKNAPGDIQNEAEMVRYLLKVLS